MYPSYSPYVSLVVILGLFAYGMILLGVANMAAH
jgi:hypothetical protein